MPDFKVEIRARLAEIGLSPVREAEIVEELSQHLEEEYERALSCGTSEEEARQQVLEQLNTPDLLQRELKKGSAELMILALLENRPRHGYEIAQLIELRSRGAIRFNVASLYPLLYRLEKRNWIRGRWVEKPGQRRRRYYRLTASGKNVLSKQRAGWREFVEAINLITGIQHA